MPFRPESELKRPDLKGEFICGACGKTFCHAASLNRHRVNFHGDNHTCMLCGEDIAPNTPVRQHMMLVHGIRRLFTCGCCNWAFPDKKELHAHNNSMARTGQPGGAHCIAKSGREPGSLIQPGKQRDGSAGGASPASQLSPSMIRPPKQPKPASAAPASPAAFQAAFTAQLASQFASNPQGAATWIKAFVANNPVFPADLLKKIMENNNAHQQQQQQQTPQPSMVLAPSIVPPMDTLLSGSECSPAETSCDDAHPSDDDRATPLSVDSVEEEKPAFDLQAMAAKHVDLSDILEEAEHAAKKRKRSINDVVSFLHKKAVPSV